MGVNGEFLLTGPEHLLFRHELTIEFFRLCRIVLIGDALAIEPPSAVERIRFQRLHQHNRRAEGQNLPFISRFVRQPRPGVHHAADDPSIQLDHQIRFRHEILMRPEDVRQIVLVASRDVHVPERLADEVFNGAALAFPLVSDQKISYREPPSYQNALKVIHFMLNNLRSEIPEHLTVLPEGGVKVLHLDRPVARGSTLTAQRQTTLLRLIRL